MTIDTKHFKEKLEAEKKLLEEELEKVGRRNPDNSADWEAVPTNKDVSQADENVVADNVEDYEDNVAIVDTLETRYQDVKNALDRIEQGIYGICQICNEEISLERLEANPSASTCRKHMK
ncbi:MAG: TraR/DksA C4-type zinc finger protein [Candidatus Zambryskibacteria bacterium]|nr:TraR/DksA C4-type zinc finger protein [Candidatus Zambryskibacteria bacterium]